VSGGALQDTRVEIVEAPPERSSSRSPGRAAPPSSRWWWNCSPYLDQEIFIRIVDNENGISQIPYIPDDKWAHINFDEFLFYPKRPEFPNELLPKDIIILPPVDPVLNAGLSGPEAAKAMTPPPGFTVRWARPNRT
jgi:hypothetical protein